MGNLCGNGSTISFGGNVVRLISINADMSAAEVDVSDLAGPAMQFVPGLLNEQITITVNGSQSGISPASAPSTIAIAWFDGGSESFGGRIFKCFSNVKKVGGVNQAIQTDLSFRVVPTDTL